MILVLVLAGLVAGLVMPALAGVLDRTQRKSALREIASALRYARSEAVSQKSAIAFQADLNQNRYWLENLRTETKSAIKTLPREIVFSGFSGGNEQVDTGTATIVFFPRGNTSGGTLKLTPRQPQEDPTRFEIQVDPVTGRPRANTYEE